MAQRCIQQPSKEAALTEPATKMPSARITKNSTASVATTVFSAFCSGVSGPPPYTWSRTGEMTVGPCLPLPLPLPLPSPPLLGLRRRSYRQQGWARVKKALRRPLCTRLAAIQAAQ